MKTRKSIARLLSFLMVLSLLLGISAAPVYAVGGEGETASFEITGANGQTGTVQYKLDGSGDFIPANNNTPIDINGATSITIKAIPNGDAQVNQSNSWISGTEEAVTFDYGALISESGWTYNIQDNDGNITFTIEFDNHDGTGGNGNQQQSGNIEVQFDTESITGNVATFTVNNTSVTVTVSGASVSDGKVSVPRNNLGSVTFMLGDTYDAANMQVIVRGAAGYNTVLAVNNNTVSLNGLNIPDGGLHFCVEATSGGETTSTAEISFAPQEGASLTVNDDGIITFTDSESVSIGTVQVYMGNSTDAYTEYLPTELPEARLAIPEGTETVKIVLEPEGDLQVQLVYGKDIREAGAISDPVINEGTYTYTITVANIPGDGSGSKFVGITVEFGTNLGGGGGEGGEDTYTVYFGEGSWEIGGVTVTADKTDVQYLAYNDIITLENFDPETMEVRVEAEDGFCATLAVTDGQTSISAHTNDGGVPADIAFSVVEKSSNPGENVYYIDLGTGSWTVGDVTVSAPDGMSGVVPILDTETIPTEMLANFDPETMDITLTVSDGFVIYLEIDENGNTTLVSTRDGVELPPYGETLTFAVVEKSSNPGENVYYIDLGTGDWTVGDVTVSAPDGMSGVVSLLDTETIPTEMLANFDPETMDITLTVSDGFVIYLEIDENGNTTLASTRDGVELPPYGATLTFAVVAKPGNMEIVDKTEENACNADLAELTDDLTSKLLTDAEKTRLENGEEVKVWLETTDISASVSQTDKALIDSKKGNATIGMYLDIDLLKQIGSDSPANTTETNGAVTITLKVPSSLINSNSSVTRTYQMIRVHNGVATVIPCTYNAANQTISCETDQFSTYALAYVDQQNNSGGGSTGNPETGDNGNLGLWMILSVLSCCSMIALIVIDKKRKIAK